MQTIEALPLPVHDHCTVIWVLDPAGGALYYCKYMGKRTGVQHELWHNYGKRDCADAMLGEWPVWDTGGRCIRML